MPTARPSALARPTASGLSLPKAGIAGALGIATIAAPLSGVMTVSSVTGITADNLAVSRSAVSSAAFPALATTTNAVEDLRLLPDDTDSTLLPDGAEAGGTVLVSNPTRSNEEAVLPGCDGATPTEEYSNGELPDSVLCTLWDDEYQLRSDAAVAAAKLNIAYEKEFGEALCVSDAYRTYDEQVDIKSLRGDYAATPGKSEHGYGIALDLCGGVDTGGVEYEWMRANAPAYGWDNPDWARSGGSGPEEAWHWEYVPASSSTFTG